MENAIIVQGIIKDSKFIILDEMLTGINGKVEIIIRPLNVEKVKNKRKAGLLKGKIRISEDFDKTLEELKEYME